METASLQMKMGQLIRYELCCGVLSAFCISLPMRITGNHKYEHQNASRTLAATTKKKERKENMWTDTHWWSSRHVASQYIYTELAKYRAACYTQIQSHIYGQLNQISCLCFINAQPFLFSPIQQYVDQAHRTQWSLLCFVLCSLWNSPNDTLHVHYSF